MTVMIGVDPHKGSHTAVAVDAGERSLAELRVRSGPQQLARLVKWAEQFPERTWAIENATGLGYLLAQQLVTAGERVLDVQPKLAARVRLLATESTNKNDPTRRAVGCHRRAAVTVAEARRGRGSRRGDEAVGETSPEPVEHTHPDRLPPSRGAVRSRRRRRSRRDLCR